ncbi:MAG TPA: porin family protein [Fibrobacteria bacterium]|nr:porin family protein [Fibrobacteria bacterium]
MNLFPKTPRPAAIAIALFLCAGLPVASVAAGGISLGGGLNSSFSDLDYSPGEKLANHLGFNIGVGRELQMTPVFFLVPEVNLETRGQDASYHDEDYDIETKIKLLYLQVPVFAMFKAPVGRGVLDVFAGPSFGILLTGKGEAEINGTTFSGDIKDGVKPMDFGIEMGAGLEFPVGVDKAFFIRAGYYHGFVNILDSDDDDEADDEFDDEDEDSGQQEFHSRNVKIKAGLLFPL